jgi:glycosyltransferase involved in cell wall biosynthesis
LTEISVIVPAYNAASTIAEQLEALAAQDYRGEWEVIVADNGSTDGTRVVAESFESRHPRLRVVDASARRGAAAARNRGAAEAGGRFLAFCDADDRVETGWLSALSDALARHAFVTGAIDHEALNPGQGQTHWHSHVTGLPKALHFKPYALSGNMAVSREVFAAVGGFPEDLGTVGEDVAVSWEIQLAGHDLGFEPDAVVAYRHKQGLQSLWRQHRDFGRADPALYKRYRSRGVPPQRALSVLAAYARLLVRLPLLLWPEKRPAVVRGLAKRWGRLVGSIRERVFYL